MEQQLTKLIQTIKEMQFQEWIKRPVTNSILSLMITETAVKMKMKNLRKVLDLKEQSRKQ